MSKLMGGGEFAKCPKCNSPAPRLHPAVQLGGEVSVCPNPFHIGTLKAAASRVNKGAAK